MEVGLAVTDWQTESQNDHITLGMWGFLVQISVHSNPSWLTGQHQTYKLWLDLLFGIHTFTDSQNNLIGGGAPSLHSGNSFCVASSQIKTGLAIMVTGRTFEEDTPLPHHEGSAAAYFDTDEAYGHIWSIQLSTLSSIPFCVRELRMRWWQDSAPPKLSNSFAHSCL